VGPAGWITGHTYGIAVSAQRTRLLAQLNEAIAALREQGEIADLAAERLTTTTAFNAGESLIGTPDDEIVIGTTAPLTGLDPAELPSPLSWEIKMNTTSGLFRYNAGNELEAVLVDNFVVSEDQLQYTFTLKDDLQFPDGRSFTADDVVWSIRRSVSAGNWLVNSYLKDDDEDGFADPDAIQSLGRLSVRLRLQAPTSYFLSLLATPPYYVSSQDCLPATLTPAATCGGIGPYTIAEYVPEDYVLLRANPEWPGEAPGAPNVRLRFYGSSADLQVALENERIDVAWRGLAPAEYEALAQAGFAAWTGPAIFKSYLVFEQSQPPWDDERVRQAVAYAVDREALAEEVFQGTRLPLYGPVPDAVPGHNPAAPQRDLDEARALLAAAGYSEDRPLEITLWYLNDGRYGPYEAAYAAALQAQLEETGAFQVTLESEAWGVFRQQSATCNYPLYLLGWPPSDSPPRLIEAIDWMEYFITNTDTVCSNYESEAMSDLLTELEEVEPGPESADQRFALYAAMQELWATELPTLDLVQEPAIAAGIDAVSGVTIDAMGLLHYAELAKAPSPE
jgi:peptide/nickel transport system substrate-binding protein